MRDPGKEARAAAGIPVVPALDGFRAFAILGVVLYHVLLFSGAANTLDGVFRDFSVAFPLGVDTLFVISGFVVFMPTVARGGEFGSVLSYAVRRFARLVPAYWVVVCLIFVLIALVPPSSAVFLDSGEALPLPPAGEFIGHLLFLQTPLTLIDSNFTFGLAIDGPLWTLSLEIGFYIVLPFIAAAYFRHPLVGLAAAAAISIAWRLVFGHLSDVTSWLGIDIDSQRIYTLVLASDYQLPAWAYSFGAGMTAAWAYVRLRDHPDQDRLRRLAGRVQPIALIAFLLAIYLSARLGLPNREELVGGNTVPDLTAVNTAGIGRREPLLGLAFTSTLSLLILATAYAPRWQQSLVANPLIRKTGDISYGVYLIHFPVLAYLLVTIGPIQNGSLEAFALWTGLVLVFSVAYGYLSARFIELPLRRRARRFGRRGASAGTGTT